MLHYFASGPEANGYEVSGLQMAPEINEYKPEAHASPAEPPTIIASNINTHQGAEFNESAQRLLSGFDLKQNTKSNKVLRKINCWDIVIDVPKAVSILTLVEGREDVLHLVNNLRKNLLCDILSDLRIRPLTQEKNGNYELIPTDRNYLIEFPHFMARAERHEGMQKSDANERISNAISDPHLHWHHLLPNTGWRSSQGAEDMLRPLHIRGMVNKFGMCSALYQNKLIAQLLEIGIAAKSHPKHQIIVDGLDESIIERFSQRTRVIEEEASRTSDISARQKASIAKSNRLSKDPSIHFDDLRAIWKRDFSPTKAVVKSKQASQQGHESATSIDQLIKEALDKKPMLPINQFLYKALNSTPSICDIHDLAERINRCTNYVFLQRKNSSDGILTERLIYDCARLLMDFSNIPCRFEHTIGAISEEIAIGFQRSYREIQKQNTQVFGIFGVFGEFPLKLKPFQKWPQGEGSTSLGIIPTSNEQGHDVLFLNGMIPPTELADVWPALQQHLYSGGQVIIHQPQLSGHKQSIGLLDLMQRMGFERYHEFYEFIPSHSLNRWIKIADDFNKSQEAPLPYEIMNSYEFLLENKEFEFEKKNKGSIFLWFPGSESHLPENIKSELPNWRLLTGNNVREKGKDILCAGVVYPVAQKDPLYLEKGTDLVGPIVLCKNQKRPYTNNGAIYLPEAQVISGIISFDTKLPRFRSVPRKFLIGLSKDFSLHDALQEIGRVKSVSKDNKDIDLSISVDEESDLLLSNWRKNSGAITIKAPGSHMGQHPRIARLQEPYQSALPYLSKQLIHMRQLEEKKKKEAMEEKVQKARLKAAQDLDAQQQQSSQTKDTIEWDR